MEFKIAKCTVMERYPAKGGFEYVTLLLRGGVGGQFKVNDKLHLLQGVGDGDFAIVGKVKPSGGRFPSFDLLECVVTPAK